MITVLLADDHRIMREGLRALLEEEPHIKVIGEAVDGRAAVALARELSPDVLVMDVGLPGLNGIEATRQVTQADPRVRVVSLSMHADRRYVLEMLKAGAAAYVLKNSASGELIRAINAAVNGESYLSPAVAATVVEHVSRQPAEQAAYSQISPREREVLQLVAEGRTSKEIAHELHVAVKTVETHRREIMRKLDLHTVAQLTKFAVREGLTSLEA